MRPNSIILGGEAKPTSTPSVQTVKLIMKARKRSLAKPKRVKA